MMTRRRPYCRDRMCGATDCSNCYGPGYDRDDDEDDDDPGGLFSDDEDDCDDSDEDLGSDEVVAKSATTEVTP